MVSPEVRRSNRACESTGSPSVNNSASSPSNDKNAEILTIAADFNAM